MIRKQGIKDLKLKNPSQQILGAQKFKLKTMDKKIIRRKVNDLNSNYEEYDSNFDLILDDKELFIATMPFSKALATGCIQNALTIIGKISDEEEIENQKIKLIIWLESELVELQQIGNWINNYLK